MKTYTTKTTVRIGEGQLVLNPSQAAARSHALARLGDNVFQIIAPVEFKAGETFGHDLAIPKTIAACLEEAGELPPLAEMDPIELRVMAEQLGLKPHPNLGKAKLIEAIQAREDQLLAEQEQAEAKTARIAELEALPEPTPEEQAELAGLKA